MTQQPRKAPPPFSLRLSHAERARLEREAGDMPLGAYIRSRLLDGLPTRNAVATLLAWLGKSDIARNLATLAEAVRLGAVQLTPDTQAAIREACQDIAEIKSALMDALCIRER